MALEIGQLVFVDTEPATVVARSEFGGHYTLRFADGELAQNVWIGEIDTQGQLALPLA